MERKGGKLVEVARLCSVNPSTVSRVLNNSKHGRFSVSPEVRQKILDAARQLNYRPSMAARNLTLSQTKLVAVLGVGGIHSDNVGPIEQAVTALAVALDKAGYEICIQLLSSRHGAFDTPPLRVDGVVAVGPRTQEDIDTLDSLSVPYVSLNGLVGKLGSAVNPDDARGTHLAVKHLVDLGHRRIAYLDNISLGANHPSVFERRAAFEQARIELGFEVPPIDLPFLPHKASWDVYYEPFIRAAIVRGHATAVLTYSHQGALGLLRRAHDMGLSIPRDFSLICFNNEPVVRLSVPSVTAVDMPSIRMGELTADVLLQCMASPETMQPINLRLDESLVIGESTAPPKNEP